MFNDMVISDKQISDDCARAISLADNLGFAGIGYLFNAATLQCIMSDLVNIRQLQNDVNARLDNDRIYTALLLQNLSAGFPVDMVKPLFADKLPEDRVNQIVEQFRQGLFKTSQTGLNVSKTATQRNTDKPSRGSLDWGKVESFMIAKGIDVKPWSPLAKSNGMFASFRRIAALILAGQEISEKDLGFLKDGPRTRGIDSA